MIDNLTLLLAHGLLMVTAIRLLSRADLDSETTPDEQAGRPSRWGRRPRA